MPEDEKPHLERGSAVNYLHFTLPMALNFQRDSYTLWECANRMYADEQVRETLVGWRVDRHTQIWRTICQSIQQCWDGDIRVLFVRAGCSTHKVQEWIQNDRKAFPYLAGNKICNYWLNVLEKYTDIACADREKISVAVDTHVFQASVRLGLITWEEAQGARGQVLLVQSWKALLQGSGLAPADMHTPPVAVEPGAALPWKFEKRRFGKLSHCTGRKNGVYFGRRVRQFGADNTAW